MLTALARLSGSFPPSGLRMSRQRYVILVFVVILYALGFRSSLFSQRTSDSHICLGLIGSQSRADIVSHVNICDIDRHDFKSGMSIKSAVEYRARNSVGVFQNFQVRRGGTD